MAQLGKYFPGLASPDGAIAEERCFAGGEAGQNLFRAPCFAAARLTSAILPAAKQPPQSANGFDGEVSDKAGRRNSWTDMPKFLLAGAVSTTISRRAQDLRGAIGEGQAGVHHRRAGAIPAGDDQVDLEIGGAARVLERQHAEPLPHDPLQVHQLRLLRHVLRLPAPRPGEEGDHQPRQTRRRRHLRRRSHRRLPPPRHDPDEVDGAGRRGARRSGGVLLPHGDERGVPVAVQGPGAGADEHGPVQCHLLRCLRHAQGLRPVSAAPAAPPAGRKLWQHGARRGEDAHLRRNRRSLRGDRHLSTRGPAATAAAPAERRRGHGDRLRPTDRERRGRFPLCRAPPERPSGAPVRRSELSLLRADEVNAESELIRRPIKFSSPDHPPSSLFLHSDVAVPARAKQKKIPRLRKFPFRKVKRQLESIVGS